MKKGLIVIIVFLCACNGGSVPATPVSHKTDTVFIKDTSAVKNVSNLPYCDSLKRVNDSLTVKLFLANYKVEKVKFYLKIVNKKPSQIKFLKGWINRAVK